MGLVVYGKARRLGAIEQNIVAGDAICAVETLSGLSIWSVGNS